MIVDLPASHGKRTGSKFVKANDQRVLKHLRQHVKAVGVGWNPIYLTAAWRYSVARLETQGSITFDKSLGGFVPSDLVEGMRKDNAGLSSSIINGSRPYLSDLSENFRRACARLVTLGVLTVDVNGRVKPTVSSQFPATTIAALQQKR